MLVVKLKILLQKMARFLLTAKRVKYESRVPVIR